ncbi:MAG: hypothetical protein HY340_01850 [Candidatus Kerfeldbacteria bacterium]|nr:hypothetical protein [Candidatus Kerfeldbacteria bacterium]
MTARLDTPPLRILRLLFFTLFFALLWGRFGWGVAIAVVLIFLATGVQGERRSVFVPVSGLVRVAIELLYILVGVVVAFQVLGAVWGIILAVIQTLLIGLSAKRYRHFVSMRH